MGDGLCYNFGVLKNENGLAEQLVVILTNKASCHLNEQTPCHFDEQSEEKSLDFLLCSKWEGIGYLFLLLISWHG